jgi:hypothetical protein
MSRRFSIFDGMILVVVCAVSLAGVRALRGLSETPVAWWGVWALYDSAWIALACSLALIPLRLHGLRPRPRLLWRQPGWLACLGVLLAVFVCLAQQLLNASVILIQRPKTPASGVMRRLFTTAALRVPNQVVFSVAAIWVVLALSGRWTSEKSWIDRLGRLLGGYWIVFPLLVWVVELVAAG